MPRQLFNFAAERPEFATTVAEQASDLSMLMLAPLAFVPLARCLWLPARGFGMPTPR